MPVLWISRKDLPVLLSLAWHDGKMDLRASIGQTSTTRSGKGVIGRVRLSKAGEVNSKMTLRIAGLGPFAPGFKVRPYRPPRRGGRPRPPPIGPSRLAGPAFASRPSQRGSRPA
jgi:hypothetical protein